MWFRRVGARAMKRWMRLANGKVWAGQDALDIGLIDMIGGLEKSIEVAAEMAGLENYRIQSLPVLEDPFTAIMKEITGGARVRARPDPQTGAW